MTPNPAQTAGIRALNDQLRQHAFTAPAQIAGAFSVLLTQGCQALTIPQLDQLTRQIAGFDAFDDGNDPYGEHDFGCVTVAGERYFFKIDYYDLTLTAQSPDPADAARTIRVLTIMRADEY